MTVVCPSSLIRILMKLRHEHPFLQPHKDDSFVPFAHRGGFKNLPENSLAAFTAAVDAGFRYLETDVQVTRDGHLVAFHDSNLLRTCGVDRDISTMSREEVTRARIDGREPVPFLVDLFEALPGAMFNIDAKSDASVDVLIDFLDRSHTLDRVCIGSFSHHRLTRIRQAFGPKVCTSASPREVVRWLLGAAVPGPSCVQIPPRQSVVRITTASRVARSKAMGLPVHVWTIDDAETMQKLIDIGVDGIMTDEAHTLRQVVERNQLWK
ncbi:MAG: glycerophosphodiester phosphodiesterase family protein [Actinomycetota bacterium]